ncbi:MAG: hypothetical protein JWQ90_2496 [Hydrocarboniphaga sp.]|uniref:DUF4286 family protein n=1 Tax=Hydrocarboniphaga sp. TaxID=2033016 RepID=UPI00262ABE01|nr:DUF4286 family protein [Hydrocarboniphaga sp.]MDB5970046.1 hypothetical protein [Hydrocarboniphaga sp.]
MKSGKKTQTAYLIAFTNPLPGKEDEYNQWYDKVHLKEVVAIDGFISGRRFKLAPHQMGGAEHQYRYMVMYEVESGKSKTIIEKLVATMPGMRIDPVVDLAESPNFLVESIGDRYLK